MEDFEIVRKQMEKKRQSFSRKSSTFWEKIEKNRKDT